MQIVITEDNEDSRFLLKSMLESMHYTVIGASNGKEALRLIKQSPPDLIISDILMPEMDGYALCRAVKADENLKSIPFIFHTATYKDAKDKSLAMELGAARFILKPAEINFFLREIEQVFEEYQSNTSHTGKNPEPRDNYGKSHSEVLARKLDKKIHELEKEKIKLQSSEYRYRRLVEALHDDYFFYTIAPDGCFSYLSPSVKSVLGYSPGELLTHFTTYLTDKPINKKAELFTHLNLTGEKQAPFELEVYHKNRTTRYIEVTEEPIFNNTGSVIGVEGIAHDITKRKRDEEELDKIGKSLQIAQHIARLGNWDLDLTTDELWCSDEIFRIFEISPQDFGNNSYESFLSTVHPDDKQVVHRAFNEALAGKKPFKIDHRIIMPDGSERFVHEQAEIISDKKTGASLRMVGTIQDITERTQMEHEKRMLEDELRQAQKMEAIGTLASGIAHDFNNILTPIMGYAGIAVTNLPEDSMERIHQQRVIKAAERAKDLVNQILMFSRKTEPEQRLVKVHQIVTEAMKLLRSTLPATIEIVQDIQQDCGTIMGDPTQLHQVIMNLCTNAYHAMQEEGGTLGVTIKEVEISGEDFSVPQNFAIGKHIFMEISDTGCGMDSKTLDKIYDPYFTTKEKGKGTGLGLAVVHGIVKSNDGHIVVNSKPGASTVFQIYFPCISSGKDSSSTDIAGPLPGGTENIMVVEDEIEILHMEQAMFEKLGYNIFPYSSSNEALEAFQSHKHNIDLVITDMTMPKMTGAELAKKMIGINPNIPIIMCSGFSETIDEEKAKSIGIYEYVMKPLVLKDFAHIIRKVLDHSNTLEKQAMSG